MYKSMSICFVSYFHTSICQKIKSMPPLTPPIRYRFVQKLTLKLPFRVDANLCRLLIVCIMNITVRDAIIKRRNDSINLLNPPPPYFLHVPSQDLDF